MKPLLVVSPALFAIACCLPALEFKHSGGTQDMMWGANILLVGWSGIFAGVTAWYANPFWLLGVFLSFFRKRVLAAVAGVIAMAIAYSTFSIIGQELPADEGNVAHMTAIRLLPGCYVWMAGLVILPIAAMAQQKSKKLPKFPPLPPQNINFRPN